MTVILSMIYTDGRKALKANILVMILNWAIPWENVSSGVSDQARHKPACAATEAS